MPDSQFSYYNEFNLKLEQLDGQDKASEPRVVGSILITYDTLQTIAREERVLVWALPLAALQRKIGESGRFVLPNTSIIDNPFEYTLNDHREWQTETSDTDQGTGKSHHKPSNLKQRALPPMMVINWFKQAETRKGVSEDTRLGTSEVDSGKNESKKNPAGPMKEEDWDYVFQANKILSCSYVDSRTSQVLRASHAAFRLKTSNEDDAEPYLPQDDKRAEVPVWALPNEPSQTYIRETSSELETSAMMSGHSKTSFEIGLSGAYKSFSGEAKYGRTTDNAYKDTNTYGKKESIMAIIHEIPIIELNLDENNCRISEGCRQTLLRLRDERSFSDLMAFFAKYGTMYSKKVILGGRLIGNRRFFSETSAETRTRRQNAKNDASLTLRINPFSIKGNFSDEHGNKQENKDERKAEEKTVYWTAVGGNAGYASKPQEWLPTVADYRNWKIVQNDDVVPIQDFISSLQGYEDISALFQEILNGGLYNPQSLHLGPKPSLPGQKAPFDDGLDIAPLGAGINTLTLDPNVSKESALAASMQDRASSRVIARGGISWKVLDSADAVQREISSTLQSRTNTSVNRSAVPAYLYSLSLEPRTVSVVLEWSSDLVEKGLNLGPHITPGLTNDSWTALLQLAPQQGIEIVRALNALQWSEELKKVEGLEDFAISLDNFSNSIKGSPLAFEVISWQEDLKNQLNAKAAKPEAGAQHAASLQFIKAAIRAMFRWVLDEDTSAMTPFEITQETRTLLENKEEKDLIAKLGHQFVESYTEKSSLHAVWHLNLPGALNDTKEAFYALRVRLQKYFLNPRSVSEVCGFLTDVVPDTKVSIFGYRPVLTGKPIDLINKHPSVALYYLTQDALLRSKNRVGITMRPWKGLNVSGISQTASDSLASKVSPVAPEEFFVLETRKAERLLLLLKIYSDEPSSGVMLEKVHHFGETLDKILNPNSLDQKTGKMVPDSKDLLIELVQDLEDALPKSNPERSSAAGRKDPVVKGHHE